MRCLGNWVPFGIQSSDADVFGDTGWYWKPFSNMVRCGLRLHRGARYQRERSQLSTCEWLDVSLGAKSVGVDDNVGELRGKPIHATMLRITLSILV